MLRCAIFADFLDFENGEKKNVKMCHFCLFLRF